MSNGCTNYVAKTEGNKQDAFNVICNTRNGRCLVESYLIVKKHNQNNLSYRDITFDWDFGKV